MRENLVTGLHHVTALGDSLAKNLDFYAGILGLRLVKQTVNFDAPDVYHLYYGDTPGTPGTIMTFFPYAGIPKGRKGKGQVTVTSLSIPEDSISYWTQRLEKFGIPYRQPQLRFDDEAFIYFEDYDGLGLELVATTSDRRPGFDGGVVPPEHAVKGFYGVTLAVEGYERTAGLLTTVMDHDLIAERGNRFRFSAGGQASQFVDVVCSPDGLRGLGGGGTVHHLAFATANDDTQQQVREKIMALGLNVTPSLDRQYFHSVYFREPAGILFEVATSDIGFTLDESLDDLGQSLKLPPWAEPRRAAIEASLKPIRIDVSRFVS